MSDPGPDPPRPAVPSTARLAWLLFMQPLQLRRMLDAWGLHGDPSLWSLRRRWREPTLRSLARRLLALLLVWTPLLAVALTLVLSWKLAIPLDWPLPTSDITDLVIAATIVSLTILGALGGIVSGAAVGMAVLLSMILTVGLLQESSALSLPIVAGIAANVAFLWSTGTAPYASRRANLVVAGLVPLGAAILTGMDHDVSDALIAGALALVTYFAVSSRLPLFLAESAVVFIVSRLARDPARGPRAALWLPYRHHDLIHFPLPWLERTLLATAEHSPNLARELIDEAATTLAQAAPARRAFNKLQARALRQAAENSAWQRIKELKSSFFPAADALQPDDPLKKFNVAATDLHAAAAGGSQHRRRNLLDRAAQQIDELKRSYLATADQDERAALLHDVAVDWSQRIATLRQVLTRQVELDPEIPNVYVVGPPLNPADPQALQLFRARRDLISIIERDLDDAQRGVIFLVGQRRMGKTSLLAMLPTYLGTTTTIVTCDFQGMSGHEHGRALHRWVALDLAAALAGRRGITLPPPALTDAWGSALAWLTAVDAELARVDHRVLIAIDEVERLQGAVHEGWGSLAFLDFVRAAGDRLRRIRLLLVSAHPLANPKLGPAWVDRLISVLPRTLGPLEQTDADDLLCRPVPTFPTGVFTDDAARTILAQTGRHPFLIQAVGKEVVQRLLKDHRRTATQQDVERALDGAVKIAEGALFTYLWDSFDPAEQTLMRALAGGALVDTDTGTFRVLREQWFVELHDARPAVAFPLFARWIRDYRSG